VRQYAALVIGIGAALLCARLGTWQLSRLEERRSLNRTIETRLGLPPLQFDSLPAGSADALTYRKVTLAGRADYAREVVVVGRSMGGVPGVHVVTPVITEGGAVLVERLWVRSPDAATVDLATTRGDSFLSIEGVFMPPGLPRPTSQDGWPILVASINAEILTDRFPYPLYSLSVRGTSGQVPVPLPDLTEGSHRSYAVQWFAFAAIALVGSGILVFRERQPSIADHHTAVDQ